LSFLYTPYAFIEEITIWKDSWNCGSDGLIDATNEHPIEIKSRLRIQPLLLSGSIWRPEVCLLPRECDIKKGLLPLFFVFTINSSRVEEGWGNKL